MNREHQGKLEIVLGKLGQAGGGSFRASWVIRVSCTAFGGIAR